MLTENRRAGALVLSVLIALTVAGVVVVGFDVSAEIDRGKIRADVTLDQPLAVSVALIELDPAPTLSSESCSLLSIQGETLDDQELPQMDHRPKCGSGSYYRCRWVYIGGSSGSKFVLKCVCWPSG